MSKLIKALDKAKKARQSEIGGLTFVDDTSEKLQIAGVNKDSTPKPKPNGLDVSYSQTKVTNIDPSLLKRSKIFSLFHDFEITDQIKTLRTQIIKKLKENKSNSLMVTSANPYEGKSFTSINLGVSIAHELDKTVLIIDTDLRKHTKKHKKFDSDYFNIRFDKGLSDYLLNGMEIPELLVNPGINRLVLLPAGRSLPNSAEYLGSPRMEMLVNEMKSRYESDRIIIFDTSSVLTSADPIVVSRYVDGILLVIEENQTTSDQIKKTIELLEGRPIWGTVMNKIR